MMALDYRFSGSGRGGGFWSGFIVWEHQSHLI